MTIVAVGTPVCFPPTTAFGASAGFQNVAIGTIGYGLGGVFQSPITDTITHISFRTGNLSAGTLEVRVETVDPTTGLPSGTLWAANTNGTRVMVNADDNTVFEVALTSAASVAKGDLLAITVTTTTGGMGNLSRVGGSSNIFIGYPVPVINTSGAWAITTGGPVSVIPKFGTAGYAYMNNFCLPQAIATTAFNNTTTPDVYGQIITVPFKCSVSGIWVYADFDGDCDLKLLASDGSTVLASATIDAEFGATANIVLGLYYFDTDVVLDAGQVVYLTLEPNSASSVSVVTLAFPSTGIKNTWCEDATLVTAKDPTSSSDYTVVTDSCVGMGLLISGIDAGINLTSGLHPIEQGISA